MRFTIQMPDNLTRNNDLAEKIFDAVDAILKEYNVWGAMCSHCWEMYVPSTHEQEFCPTCAALPEGEDDIKD